MAKLKVADFYYGAVLSMLFNNRVTPALIESGEDRQVYDFTTNHKDFTLFVKYRTNNTLLENENYYSWTFDISQDYQEMQTYINEGKSLLLALVCGKSDLGESELAIIPEKNLLEIFARGKRNITISRIKGERAYRISVGGGREKAIKIKYSNFMDIMNM